MAAVVIIAVLALTMVIGVQIFDVLAVHGGGKPVLPFTPLLDGIVARPEAREFWWAYVLLLSTMIPSLINLAIGGTALMRTVPGLSPALLHFLPATGGVATYDRAWIAAVLTMQAALGAVLGVAVQALVAWSLIFYVMPAVGLGLLDLARTRPHGVGTAGASNTSAVGNDFLSTRKGRGRFLLNLSMFSPTPLRLSGIGPRP